MSVVRVHCTAPYTVIDFCVVKGPSRSHPQGHTQRQGPYTAGSPTWQVDLALVSSPTFADGDVFFVECDVQNGSKEVSSQVCTYHPSINYSFSMTGTSLNAGISGPV